LSKSIWLNWNNQNSPENSYFLANIWGKIAPQSNHHSNDVTTWGHNSSAYYIAIWLCVESLKPFHYSNRLLIMIYSPINHVGIKWYDPTIHIHMYIYINICLSLLLLKLLLWLFYYYYQYYDYHCFIVINIVIIINIIIIH
jgi:hypothetical protein